MSPRAKKALDLIRRPIGACPTSFLEAGVGARYSARIHELRQMGYAIERRRCDIVGHSHPTAVDSYHLAAFVGRNGQTEIAI